MAAVPNLLLIIRIGTTLSSPDASLSPLASPEPLPSSSLGTARPSVRRRCQKESRCKSNFALSPKGSTAASALLFESAVFEFTKENVVVSERIGIILTFS